LSEFTFQVAIFIASAKKSNQRGLPRG